MQTLKTAVTKYKGGLTEVDIESANEWLKTMGIPLQFEATFYTLKKKPKAGDPAKIDAIWLDNNVHRPRLSYYHLSVFTTDRDMAYELSPGRTGLRGYQSFPNMPIGEAVVYTRKGDYINRRLKTTRRKQMLTQGAYTLIHEAVHWFYDVKGNKDTLHDLLDSGSDGYLALADALEDQLPTFKTLKYAPEFAPAINHLEHYWAGNVPKSLVFHTLLGSVEGSYSWLKSIKLSYNYIVAADGTVYEQVHWSNSAWHAGVVSKMVARAIAFFGKINPNRGSVGIAFERNGEEKLTDKQVVATVELVKWLGQLTGFTYDWDNTFCHIDITSYKPEEVRGYRTQVMEELLGDRGIDTGALVEAAKTVMRLPVSKAVKISLLTKITNILKSLI